MENEESKNKEGQEQQNAQAQQAGKPVDTPAFIKKMLETLGCKTEENKDNKNAILTTYQGEKFVIETAIGIPFIRIHDFWWYTVDMEDMAEMNRVRETINRINMVMPGFSVVYEISPKEKLMGVHTGAEVVMIEPIPNCVGYFQRTLDGFIQQKKNFADCLAALKKAEEAAKQTTKGS